MHAFANEVWRLAQDAMINAIVSDTERPVYSLRVELLARARHPKIVGRVSLAFEQRVESDKLQFEWRSSLAAPTESDENADIRVEGNPQQMIDAFQKALSAEVARWLTHLSFSEDSEPATAAIAAPVDAGPKLNLDSLEITAVVVSLAAVPTLPERMMECRERVSILLLDESPSRPQRRQLADFCRGVMAMVEQAIERSRGAPGGRNEKLPVSVKLDCGDAGSKTFFEFSLGMGPTLDFPARWRLRIFPPGEEPHLIAASAEIETLLEAAAELLAQKTSEWFSHIAFHDAAERG